jgi:hypothetical protein
VPCPRGKQLEALTHKNGDWVSLLIATGLLDGTAGLVDQAISQFMKMIDDRNALVIMKCGSSTRDKAKNTPLFRTLSLMGISLASSSSSTRSSSLSSLLGSASTLPPWARALVPPLLSLPSRRNQQEAS